MCRAHMLIVNSRDKLTCLIKDAQEIKLIQNRAAFCFDMRTASVLHFKVGLTGREGDEVATVRSKLSQEARRLFNIDLQLML